MCKGGGAPTTSGQTQNQNVQYTPFAQSNFQDIYNRANTAASQPYNPYGEQLVAGLNQQQGLGINKINQYAEEAQQDLSHSRDLIGAGYNLAGVAGGIAQSGTNPITGQDIQGYMNPYQQNVINTTMANINQNNALQQQQLQG